MIATFQQHANLFAALHPAPDQPHETLDAAAVDMPLLQARVITPDGFGGIIVAVNPNDSTRVIVRRWNGWQWLVGKAYSVDALVFVDGVSVESEAV